MVLRRLFRRDRHPITRDTETWRDPRGYTLRDRLRQHGDVVRGKIDALLRRSTTEPITVADLRTEMSALLRPSLGSTIAHPANVLAQNETRRAREITSRDVAMIDPAGGFLRYRTSLTHPRADECDGHRDSDTMGLGAGIYTAAACPLPPVHVGCVCYTTRVTRAELRSAIAERLSDMSARALSADATAQRIASLMREMDR